MKQAILAFALAAASVTGQTPDAVPLVFTADMQGRFVAPAPVDTAASARATGVLVGDRFTVHGSFSALSSALRDLEKTPDDPGVHLHRGAPGITTPYFHGLRVKLNADGRSGIFWGTTTLTTEHRQALLAGESYVDIHTVKFGPGEVRDQWRAVDPGAAAALLAATGAPEPVAGAACHTIREVR